ncbi:isochorismatase [Ochrobactrum sp. MR28]|nr:isochorismatase [Ochrobactrum sp. MR28]MBX8818052.1 isochorismatase [Ochrobactrum sp. MR31]
MTIPKIADYAIPQPATYPANKTAWTVDPSRAVLLIHDMQRYFLRFYDAEGTLMRALVQNLVRLRQWAKSNNIPVVYTAQPHEQTAEDRALLNDMWGPGLTVAEQEVQQIIDELAPDSDDLVLTKWRYSAFQRSPLKQQMTEWKRDQLIIGGVYAHIGCMITAVEAFMSDIQPFLAGDAVADFSEAEHRMALNYVATRCGCVVSTDNLVQEPASGTSRNWLQERVLQLVEDTNEFDADESLIFYGLDSLKVMKFSAELKERGLDISFEELALDPTLTAWWALIEKQQKAA